VPWIWLRARRGTRLGGLLTAIGAPDTTVPSSALPIHRSALRTPRAPSVPGRRSGVGALGRVEVVAVLVAAALAFAYYAWSSRYWIDLLDEGYFLYLASRVQAGDLPYRDFDTYYTPGIFYLFAWTFNLFGLSVVPIRLLMAAMRVLLGLLLYRLTRRVAAWPFALLPFLIIAAVDGEPVFPEPHPSWPAILASLGLIEAIVRHQTGGGRRWLVVAGALAGVACAFKQNVGAFAVLAIGGYLLFRECRPTGMLLHGAQGLFALALAAAVTVLLWPGLSPQLAVTVWLPILATLGLLVRSAWARIRVDDRAAGLASFAVDAAAAAAAFVAVTLAWLVPLTLALGFDGVPWGLFIGNVNQGALILPLDPPPPATRPVLLLAIWLPTVAALAAGWRGRPARALLIGGLVASVLAVAVPVAHPPDESLAEDAELYPWLSFVYAQLGTLFIYLPALGAWAGLALLGRASARRAPIQPLAWYLLAGTLVALALYPRVDVIHAMFAGPPLLVVGAWGLARAHRALAGHAGRLSQVGAYLSLLVVPIAAVAPHAYWRYVTVTHADPRAPTPPAYVDLGLARARVRVPDLLATSVRGAVEYVRVGTPPGAPFFAYPIDPLFYFLADRPNPTRFNHFFEGALTAADLQQVIGDLERTKPRYVLWDHGGAVYARAGVTDRPLTDYIWGCYSRVATFTPYLILERRCP
jgi:hypothetical protein